MTRHNTPTGPPRGPAAHAARPPDAVSPPQPTRPPHADVTPREAAADGSAEHAGPPFTVGYDLGSVGAWLRLTIGVGLSAWLLGNGLADDLADAGPVVIAGVAGLFLAILAVYTAAFWWLGPRLLARTSPWVATAIFYGPVLVAAYVDLPGVVALALGFYIAASTAVVVFIRYGGCEVIGIPTLLLRRRYVVYCPWNLHTDLVDKLLADAPLSRASGVGVRITAATAVAAMLVGFSGIGAMPHLRFEWRWLLAAAAGVVSVAVWAVAAHVLDRAVRAPADR